MAKCMRCEEQVAMSEHALGWCADCEKWRQQEIAAVAQHRADKARQRARKRTPGATKIVLLGRDCASLTQALQDRSAQLDKDVETFLASGATRMARGTAEDADTLKEIVTMIEDRSSIELRWDWS